MLQLEVTSVSLAQTCRVHQGPSSRASWKGHRVGLRSACAGGLCSEGPALAGSPSSWLYFPKSPRRENHLDDSPAGGQETRTDVGSDFLEHSSVSEHLPRLRGSCTLGLQSRQSRGQGFPVSGV